jgi:hypothetical protein
MLFISFNKKQFMYSFKATKKHLKGLIFTKTRAYNEAIELSFHLESLDKEQWIYP